MNIFIRNYENEIMKFGRKIISGRTQVQNVNNFSQLKRL